MQQLLDMSVDDREAALWVQAGDQGCHGAGGIQLPRSARRRDSRQSLNISRKVQALLVVETEFSSALNDVSQIVPVLSAPRLARVPVRGVEVDHTGLRYC